MEEQTSAKIEDSEDNHFSNSLSGIDYQDSATLTEIESVYFYHDFYNVRTFEAPTIQKVPSIDYLIQDEYSNNTEIDETEISQIKTDQILKIFKKPRVREKRTAGKKRGCKQGKNKNQNFHSGNSTFNFGGSSFERSHIAADSSPGSGAGPVRLSGKSPKT